MKVCTSCESEWPDDIKFCPNDGSALRPKSDTSDLIGTVIAERYHIVEQLGAGGMGTVYLGEHVKMGLKVAVKVMAAALTNDPEAIARFNREAKNAARIKHPNVCAVYDFGDTPDGLVYLATEFIEGETLTELLEREGAPSAARAASIVMQCADALQAAHDLGIVHRDLKPDNIMVTKDRDGADVVKVVDFGIAKAVAGEKDQTVTKSGFIIGTPEYMSPEQVAGGTVDGRSDVYSLALVLFRIVTGSLPFTANTPEEVFAQRLSNEPLQLSEALPGKDFPPHLQAVLNRALSRNRTHRHDSASEFGKDVVAAVSVLSTDGARVDTEGATHLMVSGTSARAPTPETPQPRAQPTPQARKKQTVAAVVRGLAVLAVGGGALTLVVRNESDGASGEIEGLNAEGDTTTALEQRDEIRQRDSTDESVDRLIGDAVKAEINALVAAGDYDEAIAMFNQHIGARPYLEQTEADLKDLYLERLASRVREIEAGGRDPSWDGASRAYSSLTRRFSDDVELRYQAALLLFRTNQRPLSAFANILQLDPSYREREPILSHVTAALVEDWWRANQRVAQELIGDYYYEGMRDRLLVSLDNEQPNVRLNAYEILRQYGEEDLASQDLSRHHLLNLTNLFELWEIGNPTPHLDRAVEYFRGLEDARLVQQAVAALQGVRQTNPEGNSSALRYIDRAIDRLRQSL